MDDIATDIDGDVLTFIATGDVVGKYGTFSMDADGNYAYTLDNNDTDTNAIAAGIVVKDTFTIQISDGFGGILNKQVDVNITGTNDKPTLILASATHTMNEDATPWTPAVPTVQDPDTGDTKTFSVAFGDQTAEIPSILPTALQAEGSYGTLNINATTGKYTYTSDPEKTQYILNESKNEIFTIYVKDDAGAYAAQTVTITIVGDANFTLQYENLEYSSPDVEETTEILSQYGVTKIIVTGAITYWNSSPNIFGDSTAAGTAAGQGGNDIISINDLDAGATGVHGDTQTISHADFVAGDDTITINSFSDGSVYGDANAATDSARGGGADRITVNDFMYGASAIYGDAHTITAANFVAGNDTIIVLGGVTNAALIATNPLIAGDANTVSGANFQAGDDHITINALSFGGVIGDVRSAENTTIAGNDTILITNDIVAAGVVYGDVYEANGTTQLSGSDTITVNGSLNGENVRIFGDAYTAYDTVHSEGHDTIIVEKDLIAGEIHGDVSGVFAAVTTLGNDTITVNGNMLGGRIYGDGYQIDDTGSVEGNDKITINGNMSGGLIFGETELVAEGGSATGNDTIIIKGIMSGTSSINAGAGDDEVTVGGESKGMTGGTIIGGDGADDITVYVGTAAEGGITINADNDDTIALHRASSDATNVTITGLDKDTDYADNTFTVDGVDITAGIEAALDANNASYNHSADLIIHFSS